MNTSIHIAFPIFSLFHACYIWNFIYLHNMMPMYSNIIQVFLSLYESFLLINWNHFNWIIQTKVMAFSCQTSQFTDFTPGAVCNTHFFRGLNSIPDTGSLYFFEAKLLRVLLQLESSKSEHRNSSYVLNHPNYSMFKNRTRNWLDHSPTLSEFLGYIESEFEGIYFKMFVLLEV